MKTLAFILGCLYFAFSASAQSGADGDPKSGEHLKFALVLTRHGVRSPTWTNARLDEYSRDPWPVWPVAPGLLTPHGKKLMQQFGTYYRASLSSAALLLPEGCADASSVFIYADTDRRTLETGRGLADGLMPGCTVDVHSAAAGAQDPIFHPAGMVGKPDAQMALAALAGRMGGDASALLPAYQVPLETMNQVLTGCSTQVCTFAARKSLLQLPASIAQGAGDHLTDIKGPLTTAATFAEDFQLEYLEGMPLSSVGWGRVNEDTMRSLMAIHAASSDLVQRTPYTARVQASLLLTRIVSTLSQAEQGKPVAGAVGSKNDKVVFLVGHDTNIANLAALLDLHWLVKGYQRDDAAPGGALVFELWQTSQGHARIKVSYIVQSPAQMREGLPLSLDSPPSKARLFLPGCSLGSDDFACEWKDFQSLATNSIDARFARE